MKRVLEEVGPRGGDSPYTTSLSTPLDFSHNFPFCLFLYILVTYQS